MKRIGIIAGLGPESTVDYYNRIIAAFRDKNPNLNYPEIIMYSVNLGQFLNLMDNKQYAEVTQLLNERLIALKNAGAEFAAISSNSPHVVYNNLKALSPLPLISIVEACCLNAKKLGIKKLGLLGTKFTMENTFYQEVFQKHGLALVVPDEKDIMLIHRRLFTEIELGIYKEETKLELLGIVEHLMDKHHIDSIILGCTELPLILTEPTYIGLPFLNTTQIHVDAIVEYCLNN